MTINPTLLASVHSNAKYFFSPHGSEASSILTLNITRLVNNRYYVTGRSCVRNWMEKFTFSLLNANKEAYFTLSKCFLVVLN